MAIENVEMMFRDLQSASWFVEFTRVSRQSLHFLPLLPPLSRVRFFGACFASTPALARTREQSLLVRQVPEVLEAVSSSFSVGGFSIDVTVDADGRWQGRRSRPKLFLRLT